MTVVIFFMRGRRVLLNRLLICYTEGMLDWGLDLAVSLTVNPAFRIKKFSILLEFSGTPGALLIIRPGAGVIAHSLVLEGELTKVAILLSHFIVF